MKKLLSILLTLALIVGLSPVIAESTFSIPVPSDWVDPAVQRVTAEMYPAYMLGTGYTDELSLDLHWPDSYAQRVDYLLLLTPANVSAESTVYDYEGDIVLRTYAEDGTVEKEEWQNETIAGQAVFTFSENGELILTFTGNAASDLNNLRLQTVIRPAPHAEELAQNVLQPLYEIEEGTAGSSLKMARTVAELISYATLWRMYSMEDTDLQNAFSSALESMNWDKEQYETFSRHKDDVSHLIGTIAGLNGVEEEEYASVRTLMEDAGVMDIIAGSLQGAIDCFSAEALIAQLSVLDNPSEE